MLMQIFAAEFQLALQIDLAAPETEEAPEVEPVRDTEEEFGEGLEEDSEEEDAEESEEEGAEELEKEEDSEEDRHLNC